MKCAKHSVVFNWLDAKTPGRLQVSAQLIDRCVRRHADVDVLVVLQQLALADAAQQRSAYEEKLKAAQIHVCLQVEKSLLGSQRPAVGRRPQWALRLGKRGRFEETGAGDFQRLRC